jgi:hypothetical protein
MMVRALLALLVLAMALTLMAILALMDMSIALAAASLLALALTLVILALMALLALALPLIRVAVEAGELGWIQFERDNRRWKETGLCGWLMNDARLYTYVYGAVCTVYTMPIPSHPTPSHPVDPSHPIPPHPTPSTHLTPSHPIVTDDGSSVEVLLLLTTHYPLPTTHYALPTTHYALRTATAHHSIHTCCQ